MTAFVRMAMRLRRRREALGWSQQYLADQIGTVQSHVSDLELGLHTPNLDTLQRWADELGFEVRLVDRGA